MAHNFGSLAFTPAVKALQERYGSRRQYARMESSEAAPDRLGPQETEFLRDRDSFYIATVTETGWPYVQHRGGPKGFLQIVDDHTLAFPDFRGNRQYISTGNLTSDNRVSLILVDYPNQTRLKILGRAEILEGEALATELAHPVMEQFRASGYKASIERAYLIHIEAFDWNCPQHITPRYTAEEVQSAFAPTQQRLAELEKENRELRAKLAKS